MQDYPIIYDTSFVIFWGVVLSISLYTGGLLSFATVAVMILVLIHHEHAHIKECKARGVKVNSVRFTWLGGMVDADILYANDAVPIMKAGVANTGYYAIAFVIILMGYNFIGRNYGLGINFANNPYLNMITSIMLFTVIMFFSNILPISYKSKKYGVITTDGWGAFKFVELRDELWNEGKYDAIVAEAK